jgi:hypothetical protein
MVPHFMNEGEEEKEELEPPAGFEFLKQERRSV